MMGVTVTVDHGKGKWRAFYSNLAESVNVQPGTEVEAGTVIGTVGTTAVSESADAVISTFPCGSTAWPLTR